MKGIQPGMHQGLIQQYADDIIEHASEGWGLFLWGANGRGKTFAAAAILKRAAMAGFSTYCVLANVLKVAYIDGQRFDKDETIVHRVEHVEILLIEDLGKEYSGKGSHWAELCFENLIRTRSRELRPTLITTNLSPREFKERYKDSAASMVVETMIAAQVKGVDMRKKNAQRKLEEMS